MEHLERNIEKEVTKLKYYMQPSDELVENNDYLEMEIAVKQGNQIVGKIISQLEGIKLDSGLSPQEVQQWKKDKTNMFSPFIQKKGRISEILSAKQKAKVRSNRETELEGTTGERGTCDSGITTRESVLGGKVHRGAARGRTKVGDGNGCDNCSCKAPHIKDHILQGHFI